MYRTAPLIILLACAQTDDDAAVGGGGGSNGDGGGETSGLNPVQCDLDVLPEYGVQSMAVTPDGTLFVADVAGRLIRFDRSESDAGCTLEGDIIWPAGNLDDIHDIALDDQGRLYALEFFSGLLRLSYDGDVEMRCEVESGHALAVNPAGDRAYVVGIGSETLLPIDLDETSCVESDTPLQLQRPIGTHPAFADDVLAVDAHDTSGTLPPGMLIDLVTGEVVGELGADSDLAAMADLIPTGDGYWVAGSPGGDLWYLDANGDADPAIDVEERLPLSAEDDPPIGLSAIAYAHTGQSYLAAGWMSDSWIWAVDLHP